MYLKPIHTVNCDETIEDICIMHKVDRQSLLTLNNIKTIKQGDIVVLPKSYSTIYIVKPLDTVESIAKKLNKDKTVVAKACGSKNIYVGQKLMF